jgi:hypothetical protein
MDETRQLPPRTARSTGDTPPQVQQPLPFDDESDRPVPYALTARARREVAPQDVPDLAVVSRSSAVADAPGSLDEPGDTRPSRARALRRAGMPVSAIARTLDVDELAVRAWLGDLAGRSAPGRSATLEGMDAAPSPASLGFERARERALATAADRLEHDPSFAAGLGLLAGIADVDEHSVGVSTDDPRVAATVVSWLLRYTDATPGRIRVVLRLAPATAADLARHRWAEAMGLGLEQVAHTRSRAAVEGREQALVRLADPHVAGAVTGWSQALLDPPSPEPLDAAF